MDSLNTHLETAPHFRGNTAERPVRYMIGECWLGAVLVATTGKGVCAILLGDDRAAMRRELERHFPAAEAIDGDRLLEEMMGRVVDFVDVPGRPLDFPLDPHGTEFERKVWQALREIPAGTTSTYSAITAKIGAPTQAYDVGAACAANMIAVAIPCHRVVRKDGTLAGYRWGTRRKRALLAREGAR
jgi:AraC family transcriptional regulator of adaptative response/methylated-DNA-[protein]-cysteine methyltransferase